MPIGAPQATFTVGAAVVGFDIIEGGYGAHREAQATVTRVPYSPTNLVVVQTTGLQPSTRTYRALFYNTVDYELMLDLVNGTGALVAGQPVIRQASTTAFLQSVDLNTINRDGSVEATLNFTLLAS